MKQIILHLSLNGNSLYDPAWISHWTISHNFLMEMPHSHPTQKQLGDILRALALQMDQDEPSASLSLTPDSQTATTGEARTKKPAWYLG